MAEWRGPFSLMISSRHEHAPNLDQALAVTRNVVLAMSYSRSVSPRSREILPRENRIGLPSFATCCGATRIYKISSRIAVSSRATGAAAWALKTMGRWHRRRGRGLGTAPAWSGVWAARIISAQVCADHYRSLAAAPQPSSRHLRARREIANHQRQRGYRYHHQLRFAYLPSLCDDFVTVQNKSPLLGIVQLKTGGVTGYLFASIVRGARPLIQLTARPIRDP
jgi:hypothetical protein